MVFEVPDSRWEQPAPSLDAIENPIKKSNIGYPAHQVAQNRARPAGRQAVNHGVPNPERINSRDA